MKGHGRPQGPGYTGSDMSATIAVDELRVGMFIHLDLKWWAHPFALSSFRLASPEQIATIKRLGIQQVRWSPEKSDLYEHNEAAPAPVPCSVRNCPGTATRSSTTHHAAARERVERAIERRV